MKQYNPFLLFLFVTGIAVSSCGLHADRQKKTIVGGILVALGAGMVVYAKHRNSESTAVQKKLGVYKASKYSDELITEPVAWQVKMVYHDNLFSRLCLSWIGGTWLGNYITKYEGDKANNPDPQLVACKITHYQEKYGHVMNMEEFYIPPEGFLTFNHWFTRRFKNIDTARPMEDHPLHIVSPADSKLLIIPDLSQDTQVMIKEKVFNVAKFLNNTQLAKDYEQGVMMIFRLAPYDYHHYHYPFDCIVGKEHQVTGGYHSVNPRAFNVNCKPLTENKRSYQLLSFVHDEREKDEPPVVMAQVGATAVASIVNLFMDYELNTLVASDKVYKKGDETGYFQFGGSTVVLLFPHGTIIPDKKIVENSQNGYETAVKVRETIAEWKNK